MCTLSVVAQKNGYSLAMNRDERIARESAGLPTVRQLAITRAVCPSETEGGTWIAANNFGATLALLNWNDVPQPVAGKSRSRGGVIPELIGLASRLSLDLAFADFDLNGIPPFRLIGIFPEEQSISEWRWDGQRRLTDIYPWERRHWFSSSLSDSLAQQVRGVACRQVAHNGDACSLPWLRRLHASHEREPSPFSVCVHRPEVKTVSYTEVYCTPEFIRMSYFGDSPCLLQALEPGLTLERNVKESRAASNAGISSLRAPRP